MAMSYVLERRGDQWVVKGRQDSGSHSGGKRCPARCRVECRRAPGALPPNHPPVGNPGQPSANLQANEDSRRSGRRSGGCSLPPNNWLARACDRHLRREARLGKAMRRRADVQGLQQYPFLIENDYAQADRRRPCLPRPRPAGALKLGEPLVIYSRFDLNSMLLERAERAGAQIEKTRVTGIERHGDRLAASNNARQRGRRFLHRRHRRAQSRCATSARSCTAADTMSALGYYVPGEQEHIDIQFLPDLEGYIWVFPRCGHLSVGHLRQGRARAGAAEAAGSVTWREAASRGRARRSTATCCRRSKPESWKRNRVAGDGWMAVGDAAGLVDPITGEGLYYAMRSGDLASQESADRRRRTAREARALPHVACAAISRPTWNSARAWPSASSWAASCSARCRRAWCSSRAAARASRA